MLENAFSLLFAAEQRVFLPFLVTSALIAAFVWYRHARSRRSLWSYLFPRAVWLHSSSLLDLRLIVTRGLLSLVLFVPTFLSTIAVAVTIARVLRKSVGINTNAVSPTTVLVAFTIAAFVADDLTRYLVHRLMHRVPALWSLHKVHHSAEVLTPFTLYRVHPFEGFTMAVRSAVTLGVVTGLFVWLFPGRVRGIHVFGVDVIGFAFALAGANLRHSQVWLSYGPMLEKWLISPAQHQIHHSADPKHHDRNFGASLAIWDWIFGSLYVTREREKLSFGLGAEKHHKDTVVSVLVDPVVAMVPKSGRRREPAVVEITKPAG